MTNSGECNPLQVIVIIQNQLIVLMVSYVCEIYLICKVGKQNEVHVSLLSLPIITGSFGSKLRCWFSSQNFKIVKLIIVVFIFFYSDFILLIPSGNLCNQEKTLKLLTGNLW